MTDPVAARLADRLAIGDLAHAYADAVDRRDLDAVTRLFTPDCAYEGRLGIGTIADALTVLRDAFTRYVRTMHCMSTQLVTVDGDCGRAETACVAYHVRPNGRHFTVGVRYRDDVVRTPEGWKIAHRVVETLWSREDDPGDVSPR